MHLGDSAELGQAKVAIPCPVCATAFVPRRRWAKFCSPKCRNAYHNSMAPEVLRRDLDELKRRIEALEQK